MIVKIIDSKTNKLIGEFPINLGAVGYKIEDKDYFEEAGRCAVDDALVDINRKSDYVFQF